LAIGRAFLANFSKNLEQFAYDFVTNGANSIGGENRVPLADKVEPIIERHGNNFCLPIESKASGDHFALTRIFARFLEQFEHCGPRATATRDAEGQSKPDVTAVLPFSKIATRSGVNLAQLAANFPFPVMTLSTIALAEF
jgi:hypothetical protein